MGKSFKKSYDEDYDRRIAQKSFKKLRKKRQQHRHLEAFIPDEYYADEFEDLYDQWDEE